MPGPIRNLANGVGRLTGCSGHLAGIQVNGGHGFAQGVERLVDVALEFVQVTQSLCRHAPLQVALGHALHDLANVLEHGLLCGHALVDVLLEGVELALGFGCHAHRKITLSDTLHHLRDVLEHRLLDVDALVDVFFEGTQVATGFDGHTTVQVALGHCRHHTHDVLHGRLQRLLHL